MKVTERMIYAFAGEPEITATDAHAIESGLQRVLDLIMPDALHSQRVYVDGDVVTVIDRRERPRLAYGLIRGEQFHIEMDARPIPAERAE